MALEGVLVMKIVDLFCGCGGFSLGGQNAGFDIALSVDVDPVLTSSYGFVAQIA